MSDVSVANDLSELATLPQIYCPGGAADFPGCGALGRAVGGGSLRREGRSIIWTSAHVTYRVELEIITDASLEDWSVNLYAFHSGSRDSSATWCSNYSFAEEVVVTGVLHVNTTDTSDLEAFHGRLEGTSSRGVAFVMEF